MIPKNIDVDLMSGLTQKIFKKNDLERLNILKHNKMPNYQNGKIYKITGTTDEGKELIYIGSTVQKLCKRFATHKSDKDCTSTVILNCSNCKITLIESYVCNSREELVSRERYFYDLYDCVNKKKPILYDGEKKISNHNYYLDNIETYQEYRLQTAKTRIVYDKKYHEDNKEYLNAQCSIRYHENKYEINHNKKEKYKKDEEYKLKCVERTQKYRTENRDEINRKQREAHHRKKEQKLMMLEDK